MQALHGETLKRTAAHSQHVQLQNLKDYWIRVWAWGWIRPDLCKLHRWGLDQCIQYSQWNSHRWDGSMKKSDYIKICLLIRESNIQAKWRKVIRKGYGITDNNGWLTVSVKWITKLAGRFCLIEMSSSMPTNSRSMFALYTVQELLILRERNQVCRFHYQL